MSADWLRKMQRQVRRMGAELPIDAFLPELEAGHLTPSSVRPAPSAEQASMAAPASPSAPGPADPPAPRPEPAAPPSPAGATGAEWVPGVPLSERDDAHPKRRTRRKKQGPEEDDARDLEDEIREFMQRNERGLSEEDDLSEFLGQGIDPNVD